MIITEPNVFHNVVPSHFVWRIAIWSSIPPWWEDFRLEESTFTFLFVFHPRCWIYHMEPLQNISHGKKVTIIHWTPWALKWEIQIRFTADPNEDWEMEGKFWLNLRETSKPGSCEQWGFPKATELGVVYDLLRPTLRSTGRSKSTFCSLTLGDQVQLSSYVVHCPFDGSSDSEFNATILVPSSFFFHFRHARLRAGQKKGGFMKGLN